MTAETLPPSGPPRRALQWAATQIRRPVAARGALAATSSRVFALADDHGRRFVLRLFTNQRWLAAEPDLAAHESAALGLAAALPFPTPEVIGCDTSGAEAGFPAVLMRRLGGEVRLPDLPNADWLHRLAEIPIQVAAAAATEFPWSYDPWLAPRRHWPAGSAWQRAAVLVEAGLPPSPEVFLHRDHHPMNVLFIGGEVSGVVDWVNACVGPRQVDVAHCRINLAAMYGPAVADAFRDAWCRLSNEDYDPRWDLVTLLSTLPIEPYPPWARAGLHVSKAEMERRLEAVLDRSLVELGV